MSALGTVLRMLGVIINHPITHKLATHALRLGTAELVRHIQRKTRGRKTTIHYT